jgi:YVTN family beta-propeller protein
VLVALPRAVCRAGNRIKASGLRVSPQEHDLLRRDFSKVRLNHRVGLPAFRLIPASSTLFGWVATVPHDGSGYNVQMARMEFRCPFSLVCLLAAVLLLSGCNRGTQGKSSSLLSQYAFVTNGKSGTVSVVDLATFRAGSTVRVGQDPTGITASPIRNEVYVVNTGSGTVSVLNAETMRVDAEIKVGRSPYSLELSPDGKQGYVPNSGSNDVSVIDLAGRQVRSTIPVGRSPGLAKASADGKWLVVSNREGNSVSIIDVSDLSAMKAPMKSMA